MSKNVVLYHIYEEGFENDLTKGYVGVTDDFQKRIKEHRKSKSFISDRTLFKEISQGTRAQMLEMERWLRPTFRIGWNISVGGGGCKTDTKRCPSLSKTCPVCGIVFKTPKSVNAVTCSRKCGSSLHKKIPRECVICKSLFTHKHPKQKTCSRPCGQVHSGRVNGSVACADCGDYFRPPRKTTKTCSRECLSAVRRQQAKDRSRTKEGLYE